MYRIFTMVPVHNTVGYSFVVNTAVERVPILGSNHILVPSNKGAIQLLSKQTSILMHSVGVSVNTNFELSQHEMSTIEYKISESTTGVELYQSNLPYVNAEFPIDAFLNLVGINADYALKFDIVEQANTYINMIGVNPAFNGKTINLVPFVKIRSKLGVV